MITSIKVKFKKSEKEIEQVQSIRSFTNQETHYSSELDI